MEIKARRIISTIITFCILCSLLLTCMAPTVAALDLKTSDDFSDLNNFKAYHEHVNYLLSRGIMNGTSDTTFEPSSDLTRAMVVTLLHRAEGLPTASVSLTFSDVADGQWYTDAVKWAAEIDLVKGYPDGTFQPSKSVTRQEVVLILFNYATKLHGLNGSDNYKTTHFHADHADIGSWASSAMCWALGNSVIDVHSGNRLAPTTTATRIEVAKMITMVLRNLLGQAGVAVGDHTLTIRIFGKGEVSFSGIDKSFTGDNSPGVEGLSSGNKLSMTMKAADNSFISYYVVNDGEPHYLGYNSKKTKNYTDWYEYTHDLGAIYADVEIRVYFIENGADSKLITSNPTFGGVFVHLDLIQQILGNNQGGRFFDNMKKFQRGDTHLYFPGYCAGVCGATALISQSWKSGITPASFSNNLSYAIPANIGLNDTSELIDGMNVYDFVSGMQIIAMTAELSGNAVACSYRYQKSADSYGIYSHQANWNSLFKALDDYQLYNTNPIILGLYRSSGGNGHAVLATDYKEISDTEVHIYVQDPNEYSNDVIVVKKTGSTKNNWKH